MSRAIPAPRTSAQGPRDFCMGSADRTNRIGHGSRWGGILLALGGGGYICLVRGPGIESVCTVDLPPGRRGALGVAAQNSSDARAAVFDYVSDIAGHAAEPIDGARGTPGAPAA